MFIRSACRFVQSTSAVTQHAKRAYVRHAGDPNKKPYAALVTRPPRWKRMWALALQRKAEIEGEPEPVARRDVGQWDEIAEMNCFKVRLGIQMDNSLLEAVFNADLSQTTSAKSHNELVETGRNFTKSFAQQYVSLSISKSPDTCKIAVVDYLLNSENLSYLASNLGYDDLIRSPTYPIPDEVLADSFYASVGAMEPLEAGHFLLDFLIPQLVGKDILHDVWQPSDPMSLLISELCAKSMEMPRARLVDQTGVNTVLPTFVVALYSGEKYLARSSAETIVLAETDAAKIALRRMYGLEETGKSLMMGQRVDEQFLRDLFEPLVDSRAKISSGLKR